MQRIVTAVAFALAMTLAAPAQAQETPEQQLGRVRELVMYANYRAALPAVQQILARPDLSAQQRNAGLEVLAIVQLALRDEAGARETLSRLYGRDPGHRLSDPDASPVVQSAFARAREGARAIAVTIEHTPPTLTRRVAPQIVARIAEGADAVHEIRLAYRQRGESRWTHVVLGLEGAEAEGRLPVASEDDAAFSIEYYLEALAPSSTVLAMNGSADAPLTIDVPAAAPAQAVVATGPIEEMPAPAQGGDDTGVIVAIVVTAVLLVGAGVGAGVGVAIASQGPENGSLGNVALPLVRF